MAEIKTLKQMFPFMAGKAMTKGFNAEEALGMAGIVLFCEKDYHGKPEEMADGLIAGGCVMEKEELVSHIKRAYEVVDI